MSWLEGLIAGAGGGFALGLLLAWAVSWTGDRVREGLLDRLESENQRLSGQVFELVRQITRIQRAAVGLPELAVPEPKDPNDDPYPPELVFLCSYFDKAGPGMLKEARRARSGGLVPWEMILTGLKRQVGSESQALLEQIEGDWEVQKSV